MCSLHVLTCFISHRLKLYHKMPYFNTTDDVAYRRHFCFQYTQEGLCTGILCWIFYVSRLLGHGAVVLVVWGI